MFPEVGVEGRKIPGTNTRVKYFNSDEQFDQRKFIGEQDGELKLYNLEPQLWIRKQIKVELKRGK